MRCRVVEKEGGMLLVSRHAISETLELALISSGVLWRFTGQKLIQ